MPTSLSRPGPLLRERVRALLGILARIDVLEQAGRSVQRGHATQLAREVDEPPVSPNGQRREPGDLLGELDCRLEELRARHDPVDEANPIGSLRVDRLCRQQQLHHDPLRHHRRERDRPGSAAPPARLGDRKRRLRRRDAQVAHLDKEEAAGERRAVHGRDHGLRRQPIDRRNEVARRNAESGGGHLLEVRAGAERTTAVGSENRDVRILVGLEGDERLPNSCADSRVQRVGLLRAVQRGDRDASPPLDEHRPGHRFAPVLGTVCCRSGRLPGTETGRSSRRVRTR